MFGFFRNKPITMDEFSHLYVDTDKGRGKLLCQTLARRLEGDPAGALKMLFAGHRGCGKSTELLRLQREIEKDFVILNFSVVEELDIQNLNYIELFIATMERLFSLFQTQSGIRLDPQSLDRIRNWVKTREIEEINKNYMGMGVEAGFKAGSEIPFLASFFAKFTAAAKSSHSLKETLKTNVEPKLSELISNCNLLIGDIKAALPHVGKRGVVLIVEDLDKVDLKVGEDIFYVHATQLTQLECHCIFTFPIALLYNIRYTPIRSRYDGDFVLPMIKVFEKDGGDCAEGIRTMQDIVKHRMDLTLFEEQGILKQIILYSGGVLWDLFRMIRDASDSALNREKKKIGQPDFQSAYSSLKNDYYYTIAENRERGISAEEYYKLLSSCANDRTKRPDSSDAMLDLRHNLTVLQYNGDQWSEVHPIVKDLLRERGLI
ncbi:MAG: hypothetical protein AB1512_25005 [Thermodesulfobacteriota bacterium]